MRGSRLESRLESGALLRCWKPYKGYCSNANREALGAHHYEGVAGAERLVRVTFADGEVLDFRGERGGERLWAQWKPTGYSPGWYSCRSDYGWWEPGGGSNDGWWDYGFWHPAINSSKWRMTGGVGDMCTP